MILAPVTLSGPCLADKIEMEINGEVRGSDDMEGWDDPSVPLIKIQYVDRLTISGHGTIDGHGSLWWRCRREGRCNGAPRLLVFYRCNYLNIKNLKLKNSPKVHLLIQESNEIRISHLKITAPKDSPNTDGINIDNSKSIRIHNSMIGTGDDCIAIKQNVFDVKIEHVKCGPGHGISIGSINKGYVTDVKVSHCIISDAQNGARIKTWQGGEGYVRNIEYEHIRMNAVDQPIIIDQYYCPGRQNCTTQTKAVKVSDISFKDIHGSSTRNVPIQLKCSESVACTNIELEDIKLTSQGFGDTDVKSTCINAHGYTYNHVFPNVPCLDADG